MKSIAAFFQNNRTELIKFSIVGIIGNAIALSFLYLFTSIYGLYFTYSQIIAFAIGVSINYLLNSIFTFSTGQISLQSYYKFVKGNIIALLMNLIITWLLTEILGLFYLYSAVIALVVSFIFNFVFSKYFVFPEDDGV